MAAALKGTLAGAKTFDASTPVRLQFKLTNRGDTDLYVLKWNTPLEGLDSDCLKVVRNGRTRVAYDGPLIKRGVPGPEDYLLVPAGKSVVADFNLSESYAVSRPAEYQVELCVKGIQHFPARRADGRATKLTGVHESPLTLTLIGGSIRFAVRDAPNPVRTRGEAARMKARSTTKARKRPASAGAVRAAAAPLPPTLIGGTSAQQSQVKRAHRTGFKLCTEALRRLANDSRFAEWFGDYSAKRMARVKTAYSRIIARMESTKFSYDMSGDGCRPGVFGYTYKKSRIVWLCGAFWTAPTTGTDSKAGTIVHEHSHCDAGAGDLAYGQVGARRLARTAPDQAVRNADNFEYFAGG